MHPDQAPARPGSMGTASPTVPQSTLVCGAVSSAQMGGNCKKARTRRGVADTSAEAFHSLPVADYLAPKERAVLALFTGPEVRLSRQQIAERAPMPLCGACGRVDSLLTKGALVECDERRRDPATGKSQKLLQLPRAAQGELVERGA